MASVQSPPSKLEQKLRSLRIRAGAFRGHPQNSRNPGAKCRYNQGYNQGQALWRDTCPNGLCALCGADLRQSKQLSEHFTDGAIPGHNEVVKPDSERGIRGWDVQGLQVRVGARGDLTGMKGRGGQASQISSYVQSAQPTKSRCCRLITHENASTLKQVQTIQAKVTALIRNTNTS